MSCLSVRWDRIGVYTWLGCVAMYVTWLGCVAPPPCKCNLLRWFACGLDGLQVVGFHLDGLFPFLPRCGWFLPRLAVVFLLWVVGWYWFGLQVTRLGIPKNKADNSPKGAARLIN